MAVFHPHGDVVLDVRGRILVFQMHGPANVEEIERLLMKVSDVIPAFQGNDWGAMIDAEESHLLTPDAEARLRDAVPQLRHMGHIATAIVSRDGATGAILQAQFRRIYQGTSAQIARFGREVDAVDWLNKLLASSRH